MAQADLANFFKAASADPVLLERFKASESAEKMAEVAGQAGYAVTSDDLQALAAEFDAAAETQELSDEALAGVSGGFFLSAIAKRFGLESIGQAGDDLVGAIIGVVAPKYKAAYDKANKAF